MVFGDALLPVVLRGCPDFAGAEGEETIWGKVAVAEGAGEGKGGVFGGFVGEGEGVPVGAEGEGTVEVE